MKTNPDMQTLLRNIRDVRLLVIGDVMLDHYVWGDAMRLSPEAPVPVVQVERDAYAAGGAANVALNLRALGARVDLGGCAGTDADGDRLAGLLDRAGVGHENLCRDPAVSTIVKTRVMCRRQQLCRLDREADPVAYRLDGRAAWMDRLDDWISRCDALILSDYAKGVVGGALVERVAMQARQHGRLIALDPKPRPGLMKMGGLDVLTPNRAEAMLLAGLEDAPGRPFPAREACARIHAACGPKMLVVTLGAEGMLLSDADGSLRAMPTVAREVFDVSGAGDTVIAAFTAARATGAAWEVAAQLANVAAGIVVGKLGTATATPQEILSFQAVS